MASSDETVQNSAPDENSGTTVDIRTLKNKLRSSLGNQQISGIATALALPAPQVPKFTGDLLEYSDFILAFDTRISSRTASSSDRLYYLLQHTDGEPKDLISSCIYMQADQGYSRARQLLQQEYGDPYKVSLAYLKQLNEWKPIKPDEGKCHPTAMHIDGFKLPWRSDYSDRSSYSQNRTEESSQNPPDTATSNVISHDSSMVLQAIIPVRIKQRGTNREVLTYALYDPGSTGCFLSEELKDDLQASGVQTNLRLKTMHGESIVKSYLVQDLVVSDINSQNGILLPKTYSRQEIPVSHDQIPRPELLRRWPYLHDVAKLIPEIMPEIDIGLLIGSNCPLAMEPLKIISTDGKGPFALQYRHGWTVSSPVEDNSVTSTHRVNSNRIVTEDIEQATEILSPNRILNILESDFIDSRVARYPGEKGLSPEDTTFLKKAESNVVFKDGHFEIPLPFRNQNLMVPNNKILAIKRALYQKKKMQKDPKYHSDYVNFIDKILENDYAERIPDSLLTAKSGHVWYLPHHGVYNQRKPDKIRVVFDCSAKFNGISLNDQLLQGPDLTNSLIGVLTRFREHPIAFTCDVESMFYQVKVPKHQYNHLRFLWWPNGDISKELEEYWMKVHLFGAVSSPSIANYALRRVADEGSNLSSEVAHTIKRNFYVDDCLKSVPSATEASSLIAELTAACRGCGFRLCKFTSNDVSVLNTIPADDRSKELKTRDINYDPLPTEHALGILWVVETDTFGFSVLLPDKPLTRRGILSIVSSIYDPLGFAAPFVLLAKQILQDLCKETNLAWDDEVPDDYQRRFKQWISEVPNLQKITIPRCLKLPQQAKDTTFQMHVFSDASTSGYGAVAYLTSNEGGCSKTSFLIGKARVVPLKATSIPRLELTAAAVAVNLGQKMTLELDLHLNEICYYTDSTTVLYYIRAERKRFPVFVANRVRQIRDFSSANQWKYVSTDLNPADIASRGVSSAISSDMTRWLEGPDFLNMPASECPAKMHPSSEPQVTEEDLMSLVTTTTSEEGSPFMTLITYFSRWERLKRAVAVFIAFLAFLQNKEQTINFRTTQIMQKAEKAIVCFIQKITFANEVEKLKKTTTKEDKREHSLPKTSTIFRLDPVLIDGTLRVGGRLSKAAMDSDVKHPMLLPQHSHVTTLIVRDAHEKLGHAGRNHTIAAIRERFWIVSINSAVRRQLHK
ncbi:uncharacterized protein, partial [Palaemon carinicauda]|uniref:uncharacterized protein n=1 Tax=Palaemon carinicauda TaxID=392227 RepID=UPI0035B680D4